MSVNLVTFLSRVLHFDLYPPVPSIQIYSAIILPPFCSGRSNNACSFLFDSKAGIVNFSYLGVDVVLVYINSLYINTLEDKTTAVPMIVLLRFSLSLKHPKSNLLNIIL